MSVTVKIPPALRTLCGGSAQVEIQAASVAEAIAALDRAHPGMAERICTEQGEARRHVLIYVNQDDIRERDGMRTALQNGDEVFVLPAVSGGCARLPGNG